MHNQGIYPKYYLKKGIINNIPERQRLNKDIYFKGQ